MAANNRPPDETSDVVHVSGLIKRYRQIEAVSALDLRIKRGEIFGLIGPDGAGKTTTFHILGGVMEPTAGTVTVLGVKPRDARLRIGYLTQQFSLYLDLTIDENLRYIAGIRSIPENIFQERRSRYLKLMSLANFSSRLAGQLSGGMKQKLALCCALITQPELLLLDEPTTGVDPVSRREFWDVLATVSSEGMTIAVATPYLDEAERCNRIALMHSGVIQQLGTPGQLRHSIHLSRLQARTPDLEALEEVLAEQSASTDLAVADVQSFGDRLDILVADPVAGAKKLHALAKQSNISALTVETEEPTLENVFVLTLRRQQSEEAKIRKFSFSLLRKAENTVAIGAKNLSKRFGDFQAVKGVGLQIGYGEVYGLLGANGAGKTTTIKMLCGLSPATSGEITLAGEKSDLRSQELRHKIGYMSQKFTLYDDLTVRENLEFYCGVYQVPVNLRSERINWVLATCDLLGRERLATGQLPGGWKQRLAFGASVMHEPEILFLDEPTSGVDPIARRQLWRMIGEFARSGTAVLVTTHFLEEAEHCNRLGFMVAGELVVQGTPSEIKSSLPGSLLVLVTSDTQRTSNLLKKHFEPWRVSIFADKIHIVVDEIEQDLPKILSLIEDSGLKVVSHKPGSFSLEDAFIGIAQNKNGAGS